MKLHLGDIQGSPNALARHYSRFRVAERLLLTGHSHQAWPDVGFDAQKQAWLDAAELVDAKWERVFEKWERVCRGYAALLGDTEGDVTLASSTHDLVVRFLSALPLRERPRLVTTDAEFHTIRRQLDRLAEEGVVEVVRVPGSSGYPLAAQTMARPIPVLPLVASTTVWPGFSVPAFSAASITPMARRSFTEPSGLKASILTKRFTSGGARRLIRTTGVLPIVSRMLE